MKKIWIFAFLGAMALLLLYPFETTVVPDWRIRIVDEAGNPMRLFRVREVWQHYTIESTSHEEDLITDGDGYVTFPRRTVRGSLLVRIGRPIVNVLNVHASFGPSAYVSVLDYLSVPQLFSPGQPLTTQVVVKRSLKAKIEALENQPLGPSSLGAATPFESPNVTEIIAEGENAVPSLIEALKQEKKPVLVGYAVYCLRKIKTDKGKEPAVQLYKKFYKKRQRLTGEEPFAFNELTLYLIELSAVPEDMRPPGYNPQ